MAGRGGSGCLLQNPAATTAREAREPLEHVAQHDADAQNHIGETEAEDPVGGVDDEGVQPFECQTSIVRVVRLGVADGCHSLRAPVEAQRCDQGVYHHDQQVHGDQAGYRDGSSERRLVQYDRLGEPDPHLNERSSVRDDNEAVQGKHHDNAFEDLAQGKSNRAELASLPAEPSTDTGAEVPPSARSPRVVLGEGTLEHLVVTLLK